MSDDGSGSPKKKDKKEKKKGRGLMSLFKKKEEEAAPMEIGTPYGFNQNFHVGFDPTTGQFSVSHLDHYHTEYNHFPFVHL
jgi:hypothetical protein